jgi:hypothetical protein
MSLTIALIGCSKVKAKADIYGYIPARDLYISELFKKRVAHVEARGLPWYIISAKSGLLKPTVSIRPYDKTFADLSELETAEWHVDVANQLLTELYYEFNEPKLSAVTIEFHAGVKYCEPLGSILNLLKIKTAKPVSKLGIGKQLEYYKAA